MKKVLIIVFCMLQGCNIENNIADVTSKVNHTVNKTKIEAEKTIENLNNTKTKIQEKFNKANNAIDAINKVFE